MAIWKRMFSSVLFTGSEQQMLCIRNFKYQFTIPTYLQGGKATAHKARKPTCLVLWDSQSLICVTELEIFSFLWSLVSTGSIHTELVNGRKERGGRERRELRQNKSIYEQIRNNVIMAQNHICTFAIILPYSDSGKVKDRMTFYIHRYGRKEIVQSPCEPTKSTKEK